MEDELSFSSRIFHLQGTRIGTSSIIGWHLRIEVSWKRRKTRGCARSISSGGFFPLQQRASSPDIHSLFVAISAFLPPGTSWESSLFTLERELESWDITFRFDIESN